jgi:hypothetical protein
MSNPNLYESGQRRRISKVQLRVAGSRSIVIENSSGKKWLTTSADQISEKET